MANLSDKIQALRSEAAEHGDTLQVVLCDIAEEVYGADYTFDSSDFTALSQREARKLRGVTVETARVMCREIIAGPLVL